jgi:hypothetical protein
VKRARDLAALLLAIASLAGAIGGLWKRGSDQGRDQAFAWDAYGDQVAEVERVKLRLAVVEEKCGVTP